MESLCFYCIVITPKLHLQTEAETLHWGNNQFLELHYGEKSPPPPNLANQPLATPQPQRQSRQERGERHSCGRNGRRRESLTTVPWISV